MISLILIPPAGPFDFWHRATTTPSKYSRAYLCPSTKTNQPKDKVKFLAWTECQERCNCTTTVTRNIFSSHKCNHLFYVMQPPNLKVKFWNTSPPVFIFQAWERAWTLGRGWLWTIGVTIISHKDCLTFKNSLSYLDVISIIMISLNLVSVYVSLLSTISSF